MGNRAVITTKAGFENNGVGVYLHWNGGRDSVEAFLTYCKLRGFRSPETDDYGFARLCQVIGNFFGGGLSVGIGTGYNGDYCDNGTYIIENWEIVGRKNFDGVEQHEYDLNEALHAIDEAQPESERIAAYLDAEEVPTKQLRIGDTVVYLHWDGKVKQAPVIGFGKPGQICNGHDVSGLPYLAIFEAGNDTNPNSYIYTETARRAASDADPTDPTDGDNAEALRQRIAELQAQLDAVKTTDAKIIENSKAAFESLNNRYTGLVADHRKEVTKLKKQIAALEADRADAWNIATRLQQENNELTAAAIAPAPIEEAPADPDPLESIPAVFHPIAAAALAIDGLTAAVKGAKTEKPILWIEGDTYSHRDELKALGLKYSNKRKAWYIAAADVKAIAVVA